MGADGRDRRRALVLCDPRPTGRIAAGEIDAFTASLWHIAAARIRELVTDAGPAYLQDSRAVSSERMRVTAELTEQHATALESMLAVLRSRALDDRRARASAAEIATAALVRGRTAGDLWVSIEEEPVVGAFARLRADLRPLTRYGRLDVQFVEPPVDGRALPGEVAHAARAIVRGLVLAMNDQAGVGRVRVQWDCDGTNLLINMRDDGPGDVDADAPGVRQARSRVDALGGTLTLTGVEGWGAELAVRLPLDAPRAAAEPELDLAPREHEVLRLIARGLRNRQVALELGISENTVKFHVAAIYRKLGVSTRAAAAAVAVGAGYS
ncbi:DNA-binding CsgD family transcriptional regulator [Pseudoclavibacter chungangensis]|uniref:helix-turn-helix transcriptional regulator n=1 Tax=Pseudoclavibacter chungangensis TaxID=587635 RepID=UPI0017E8E793|nr:helix-turn-helix transcriptional regulator [Pseudoclavibacter chungangensis]NYJ68018.1 DNA-binding CsgD family transcriptional regulator [Pseudoclavibacter chungangensis]